MGDYERDEQYQKTLECHAVINDISVAFKLFQW